MIVLDASVLIAHLDLDDAHHEIATALLVTATAPLLVHSMTVAEVLVAPARRGRGRATVDALAAMGVVVADRDADEPFRLAELRAGTRLKLPDCCVLDVAVQSGAPLATFGSAMAAVAQGLAVDVLP